ncbi:Rpn family recombination-promoting nuclease/putative transposase [Phormidium nigroviride]
MKTDSIFYRLFQTFPSAFFELIDRQASEASAYEFASVELKQTAFRIDGVFLPIVNQREQPIYFLEVQFQKDPELYARLFSEIFLYLRLYAPTKAWQAVVVFARRSMEPTEVEAYRVLLESSQVTRLYLSELGDIANLSLGVGMMKLVVETKKRTPELVRELVEKAQAEVANVSLQQQVLDLIETIVLYKLPSLSRQELIRMFGLREMKRTRYYQEVKEEVLEEFKDEIKEEVLEEVRQEVRQEEALGLIYRLLPRRIGAVNSQLREQIRLLSIEQLENLAEALLDFSSEADLVAWLQNISNRSD